jgi:hypothetical protein
MLVLRGVVELPDVKCSITCEVCPSLPTLCAFVCLRVGAIAEQPPINPSMVPTKNRGVTISDIASLQLQSSSALDFRHNSRSSFVSVTISPMPVLKMRSYAARYILTSQLSRFSQFLPFPKNEAG